MQIIDKQISIDELKQLSEKRYGNLVKAVVDIEKEIMVVDAELHSDEEYVLLEQGLQQQYLWGINLHLNVQHEDWIECDSMINLRPSFGNKTSGVDSLQVRAKIITIVTKLVDK